MRRNQWLQGYDIGYGVNAHADNLFKRMSTEASSRRFIGMDSWADVAQPLRINCEAGSSRSSQAGGRIAFDNKFRCTVSRVDSHVERSKIRHPQR
jgi:hypothetical protein